MEIKSEMVEIVECSVKFECEESSSSLPSVAVVQDELCRVESEMSDERVVLVQKGYWGFEPLKYLEDGKKEDGSDFVCGKCRGFCVNPVVVGCNHPSCRECLDSSENKCPSCKLQFDNFERKYLNKFQGENYYEFTKLVGKRGHGSAAKYFVKWLSGKITLEPARNVPAVVRKRYLEVRKTAKKFRVNRETAEMLIETRAKFVM